MTVVKNVLVSVIKRDWTDIEPKLLAVGAGLASSAVLIEVATVFHHDLNPALATAIAGFLSLLVGYAKYSTSKAPVGEIADAVGAVVAAAVPSIAPDVATVEKVLAPAFDTPAAVSVPPTAPDVLSPTPSAPTVAPVPVAIVAPAMPVEPVVQPEPVLQLSETVAATDAVTSPAPAPVATVGG